MLHPNEERAVSKLEARVDGTESEEERRQPENHTVLGKDSHVAGATAVSLGKGADIHGLK